MKFEEFIKQSKTSQFTHIYDFALKRAKVFDIDLEKLGVQIIEKHDDSKKKEFVISTVFNSKIIRDLMKVCISENQESTTQNFELDNNILNTLGEKLFKTKIWREWVKQFSLESSEVKSIEKESIDPSKVLFRSLENKGYEITTREFLVNK